MPTSTGEGIPREEGISRGAFLRKSAGVIALGVAGAHVPGALGAPRAAHAPGDPLKFLNFATNNPGAGIGKAMIAAASKYRGPGRPIEWEAAPFGTYAAAGITKVQAGYQPDIVMILGAIHGGLWPLVEKLHTSDQKRFPGLTGWFQTSTGKKNQFYGVPFGSQAAVWYYNKALFRRAGLNPERPPTTWAEFRNVCNALKRAGIDPMGMDGASNQTPWWMWMMNTPQWISRDSDVLKIVGGKIPINGPQMTNSLKPVQETYEQGWWRSGWQAKGLADVFTDFQTGKTAMWVGITTPPFSWYTLDQSLGKNNYGVFAQPLYPNAPAKKQVMYASGAAGLGVAAKSTNKAAAYRFIKFITSKQGSIVMARSAGLVPNRTDIDLQKVLASPGAAKIMRLISTLPTVNSPMVWFRGAASAEAWRKLSQAIASNDTSSLLDDLAELQVR